jgi:heme/copper-type cytochrome/quinol oxidase subunit 2
MELLVYVHDIIFTYCVGILLFVTILIITTLLQYKIQSQRIKTRKRNKITAFNLRMSNLLRLLKKTLPRDLFEKAYYRGYAYTIGVNDAQMARNWKHRYYYLKQGRYEYHFPENWYQTYDYSLKSRSALWNNHFVEFGWTVIPSLILIAVSVPSFMLLYTMEPTLYYDNNSIFLKVIGHQWYWSYEFSPESFSLLNSKLPVYSSPEFSSYMLSDEALGFGDLRLLSVDKPLFLPVNSNIVVRVTAEDVLHSWAVPSCGIKIDAVPGRINEISFKILHEGEFFGQCSELCGINHGFMPIHLVAWAPL